MALMIHLWKYGKTVVSTFVSTSKYRDIQPNSLFDDSNTFFLNDPNLYGRLKELVHPL